ncbi:hypothetical protein [Pantoea agglomerans]|uniref:hypothetical protein n=1 Tax=Enterobacter agglomerans TaxID=549 RepID=UPI003BA1FD87
MYLKTYLKALLAGFNDIFELFGKVQSIIGAVFFVAAILFAANFTEYLDPFKAYYRSMLLIGAFIALFISGYKAWVKEHEVNLKEESKSTEILTTKAQYRLVSYGQFDKFSTLGLQLTFQVSNFNDHPIQVKGFDTAAINKQFGFSRTKATYIPSHYNFPVTIEPNTVKEFHFELPYDVEYMNFHEQLRHVKDVSHKKYITKATILSIKGAEEIEFTIDFNNDHFINSVKANSEKFNQSIIDAIL